MTYKEIESHLLPQEKNDNLEKLLEKYQSVFDDVDYFENLLHEGALSNCVEVDDAMKKITSLFMSLNKVVMMIDVDGMEDKFIASEKMRLEKEGKDVKINILRKEAQASALIYRRVRNIFEGYRKNCEIAISACQSSLKSLEKEKYLPQE